MSFTKIWHQYEYLFYNFFILYSFWWLKKYFTIQLLFKLFFNLFAFHVINKILSMFIWCLNMFLIFLIFFIIFQLIYSIHKFSTKLMIIIINFFFWIKCIIFYIINIWINIFYYSTICKVIISIIISNVYLFVTPSFLKKSNN